MQKLTPPPPTQHHLHKTPSRAPVYNWLIYILFISESQDSPAQSMANLQKD